MRLAAIQLYVLLDVLDGGRRLRQLRICLVDGKEQLMPGGVVHAHGIDLVDPLQDRLHERLEAGKLLQRQAGAQVGLDGILDVAALRGHLLDLEFFVGAFALSETDVDKQQ